MLHTSALLAFTCAVAAGQSPVARESRPSAFTPAQTEFTPNYGRWPEAVRFHAHAGAIDAWLADDGWWLALRTEPSRAVALRMTFDGARAVAPVGCDPAPGLRNYFYGADPQRWSRGCVADRSVRWSSLAPGVDVAMRAADGEFEYDLVLAPDADPGALRIRCAGHERLALGADGALEIETALGTLRQPRPLAWELDADGNRRELACSYRVLDDATFAFELPRREPGLVAVIDPALRWATYLGGGSSQSVETIVAGPNQTVIVGGYTDSLDFPTTLGAYQPIYQGLSDGFVACMSSDGAQLVWSTMLGGTDDDYVRTLALDQNGAVVVGGDTKSNNFPTIAGSYDTSFGAPRDGFLLRLSPNGDVLDWSTFVGGNKAEFVYSLALDSNSDVVAVGATQGGTFPATLGAYDKTFNGGTAAGDAFVLKLSSDGTQLAWASYLGGGGNELASEVVVTPSGDVVLAGVAYGGAGFPLTPGAYDTHFAAPSEAFVASLDASGALLLFSTYLGGIADDEIRSLAIAPTGEIVCGGTTTSTDFPTTSGALDRHFAGASEGFVSQLSANGTQLVRSTFFGGGKQDLVTALAFDGAGQLVIAGDTTSQNLATTAGSYAPLFNGNSTSAEWDTFVARLSPDLGTLLYSSYFGSLNADHLTALAIDAQDEALLAGTTRGPNFPTHPGVLQPAYNVVASQEGWVARLAFWLHPISFGVPKLNSFGGAAHLVWDGFPSVSDHYFRIGVDQAMSTAWTSVYRGLAQVNWPFQGGRLRIMPPLVRAPRFKTDAFGYGIGAIQLDPWMVGQTLYFQAWYTDDADPFGGCMSDALRVLVYP